jgi:hypothetical protein
VTEFFKKYIFSLDKKINKQYFPGVLQAQWAYGIQRYKDFAKAMGETL